MGIKQRFEDSKSKIKEYSHLYPILYLKVAISKLDYYVWSASNNVEDNERILEHKY